MGDLDDADDNATEAIKAVTRQFDAAVTQIWELGDPNTAFKQATKLWAALRAATDALGPVRAELAAQVEDLNPGIDLQQLAERLSTPEHAVKKSRTGQLLQAARLARSRNSS